MISKDTVGPGTGKQRNISETKGPVASNIVTSNLLRTKKNHLNHSGYFHAYYTKAQNRNRKIVHQNRSVN